MLNTMVCENCTNILSNFKRVCDKCNFIRKYLDKAGNMYFVKRGNFIKQYTVFVVFAKNKKEAEYEKARYHFSFAEAQSELNAMARDRKWRVYDNICPPERRTAE